MVSWEVFWGRTCEFWSGIVDFIVTTLSDLTPFVNFFVMAVIPTAVFVVITFFAFYGRMAVRDDPYGRRRFATKIALTLALYLAQVLLTFVYVGYCYAAFGTDDSIAIAVVITFVLNMVFVMIFVDSDESTE